MSNLTKYSLFKDVFYEWDASTIDKPKHFCDQVKTFPKKYNDFGWNKSIGEITKNELNDFLSYLTENNYSYDYLKQYKRIIREVFGYAQEKNIIEDNPFDRLNFVIRRDRQHEIFVLSTNEIKRILELAKEKRVLIISENVTTY